MMVDVLGVLVERDESVATAESLTGGLLAERITDVPGASQSFRGGVVAYATQVKQDLLGVPEAVVAQHGVVSGECAAAMAAGVRELLGTTWGLATTGVAGPDPQEDKPVGTVWVAVAGPDGVVTRLLDLEGGRWQIREHTCTEIVTLFDQVIRGAVAVGEETGLG
ncbi:MAG: nicotinamide-nucleotide amidohydrolase family protein [Nocardioides sp.]|nr:nicotinamide-nucleotide amidohydrolase family protein [Nocardioides sp.]